MLVSTLLNRVRQRQATRTRAFHAYCVGSAKSGTHSMAALFARHYAARHEAEHSPMIQAILDRSAGKLSDAEAADFLRRRDQRLALDMDSSQLNTPFVDLLAREFPDAKFILTVRDVYGFVMSITDHSLARFASDSWKRLRDHRFAGRNYTPHDQPLRDRGLFPLDGYLTYWATHNQFALTHIPPERLLVVRTHEINRSIPQLAKFLDIPAETIDAGQAHSYPAVKRFGVLHELDRAYLQDRVEAICGPLMSRFFPGLGSADVALERIS